MARHELGAAERRARMIGWRSGDVLRATALVTSYLLALALAWTAREIVLTAFLGVLFGLAVGAGADQLTKLRIPRGLGAPLVVVAFLGALYGVGAALAPTVHTQVVELRTRVPASRGCSSADARSPHRRRARTHLRRRDRGRAPHR